MKLPPFRRACCGLREAYPFLSILFDQTMKRRLRLSSLHLSCCAARLARPVVALDPPAGSPFPWCTRRRCTPPRGTPAPCSIQRSAVRADLAAARRREGVGMAATRSAWRRDGEQIEVAADTPTSTNGPAAISGYATSLSLSRLTFPLSQRAQRRAAGCTGGSRP